MKKSIAFLLLVLLVVGCSKHHSAEIDNREAVIAATDSLRKQAKSAREETDFGYAIALADSSLKLAHLLNDTIRIVQALNELGTDFRRMGRMESALLHHYRALQYVEECSDTTYQARKNAVVTYNGIGNAMLTLTENEEAEAAFRKALEGETALGSALGQAINYANLGAIYEERGLLDSAYEYYKQSMFHNQKIESTLGMGLCHVHIGRIFEKNGDEQLALDEYHQAVLLFEGEKDLWHALEPSMAIASLYLKQGKTEEAEPLLQNIYEQGEKMGSLEHQIAACKLQSEMYEQLGQCRLALEKWKLTSLLQDSLENPAHDHKMRGITMEYERKKHAEMLEKMHAEHLRQEHLYNIIIVMEVLLIVVFIAVFIKTVYDRRAEVQKLMERIKNLSRQNAQSMHNHNQKSRLSESDQLFVDTCKEYIEEHLETGNITLEDLALEMNMSPSSLNRRIRLLTGGTLKSLISNIRMARAVDLLKNSEMPMRMIADKCGFDDMSYFTRSVKKHMGVVPSQLRGKTEGKTKEDAK